MYYYIKNLQGDIVKIVNESGVTIANYAYDVSGEILSIKDNSGNAITDNTSVAILNPYRYRGYVYDDETGLYYLQSRYYDPITERFLNSDDTEYICSTGTIISANLFSYCENNPVNNTDPYGYFSIPRWLVSFTIDAAIWTLSGGFSSIIASITQPIKAIARRAGVAVIKSFLKGFFKGVAKKIIKVVYAVAKFLTKFVKWSAKTIASKIAGGVLSLTANSVLKKIAPNIDIFLSIGGLIAGTWDYFSDKKLNGWIKLW